jgi:acyl-coenzyme A thioesterase PaaI-like protein
MQVTPDQMFLTKLGVSYRAEGDRVIGKFEGTDYMRVPGTRLVRAGVLATVADVVSGWGANAAVFPRIPLTVDLTLHPLGPFDGDALDVVARLLKVGRNTIVAETLFTQERPVALSHATFTVSPRPEDVFGVDYAVRERGIQPASLSRPILDDIGARMVAPGVVELDRVPYVMQPAGTIQGGAVALIAELAAESSVGAPVTDLEIRYLSAVRVGPACATAEVLNSGLVRVEVRDVGHADRLTAVVVARVG